MFALHDIGPNNITIREEIANVAQNYGLWQCVECAQAIKRLLQKFQVRGKHIRFEPTRGGTVGNIWNDDMDSLISTNGVHEVIDVEGIFFDNCYPNGIPSQEWFAKTFFTNPSTTLRSIDF